MKFTSLVRLFGQRWQRTRSPRPQRATRRRGRLLCEPLETRELLATAIAPSIASVAPRDGSNVAPSSKPLLAVTFSEAVNAVEAGDRNNYLLFGSRGDQIPIDSALYNSGSQQVTLTYNGGNDLVVDTYTLFVRGDKIHDLNDGLPLAQPGQLLVANSGANNVSLVNMPGTGALIDALTNYSVTPTGRNPIAVAIVDVSLDGLPDLITANANATVTIFEGLRGGTFATTPTVLALPANANPRDLVVAQLNNAGGPDIATANLGTDNISVFYNQALGGGISFAAPVNVAAGPMPVAIVADNFDRDAFQDLAVVSAARDNNNNFNVNLLLGAATATGFVGAPIAINTTLASPTDLAAADVTGDLFPDLVVTATSGAAILNNLFPQNLRDAQNNRIYFDPTRLGGLTSLTNQNTTSVAVGDVDLNANPDIVASTATQVLVFRNLGGGTFSPAMPFDTGNIANRGVTLADLNADGKRDIALVNSGFSLTGSVSNATVLLNTTIIPGQLSLATARAFNVDDGATALAVGDTNQDNLLDLATANQFANDVSVLRGRGDGTYLVATDIPLSGSQPDAVTVGDLNGDVLPDLVITNAFSNTVAVILSTGGGTNGVAVTYALPVSYQVGSGPKSVTLGDVTGDGNLDVVVTNSNDSTLSVLLNDGLGVFTKVATDVATGRAPTGIAAGDFNSDLKLDLAVSHLGNGNVGRGVTLLFGNGQGGFGLATELVTTVQAAAVAAADFTRDGRLDLAVVDNQATGSIVLLRGDGAGNFFLIGAFDAGPNPTSIAVGDLNRDGLPDVVVANQAFSFNSFTTTGSISVLLNAAGNGFNDPIETVVLQPTQLFFSTLVLASVVVTNVNQDFYPDVVVTTANGGFFGLSDTVNNVYTLLGNGDGSFQNPNAAAVGGTSNAPPSFVAVVSDPLIAVSTFTTGGTQVSSNVVRNGTFEVFDLAKEKGNLSGWQTFDQRDSRGQWNPQAGTSTPLSGQPIKAPPGGNFAVVLDQPDIAPMLGSSALGYSIDGNPLRFDTVKKFEGMHALYQDFIIPPKAQRVTLTFALYIDNTAFGAYSDTLLDPSLDYLLSNQRRIPNQQVRVDIVDPAADLMDVGRGVLQNLFLTTPATAFGLNANNLSYQTFTVDLTALRDPTRNRTVRLRFAAANNRGQLIVGVDNVQVQTLFNDTEAPNITGMQLRNPGVGATPSFAGATTDPTVIGQVADDGSPSNVAFVEFDPNGDGFGGSDDIRTSTFDPNGNFTFRLPISLPGLYNLQARVVDRAGNQSETTLTFVFQGPSLDTWQAMGPGPIRTSGQGVNYRTLSGRVTSVAVDPRDPSNVYYIGTANGGVWKTTNGGSDWTPLTDAVTDPVLGALPVAISSVVVSPSSPNIVYAATGIADHAFDSRPGVGILKSTDAGRTWSLLGSNVFRGARISKMEVDDSNPNRLYVAVASFDSGGTGPGLYRSFDGGTSWTNVLDPARMFTNNGTGAPLGAGFALPSVTDVVIDHLSFDDENIYVGLGNMGLVAASAAAGVWKSPNRGDTWIQIIGGLNPQLEMGTGVLPSGTEVGRITLAKPTVRQSDSGIIYALIANATPLGGANGVDAGRSDAPNYYGLYKSKDGGDNWTHVMLRQLVPSQTQHKFVNIDLTGNDGSYVGALAVDPRNPNVVFVGGSRRFLNAVQAPDQDGLPVHGLIRVDTSNMRDTTYNSPYRQQQPYFPNDGDDISKAAAAAEQGQNPSEPGSYPDNTAYGKEGVSWYDLEQDTTGASSFQSQLPTEIHALRFDAQGRLLVGADGGIWRASTLDGSYEFGAGGILSGTAAVGTAASTGTQRMTLTNLNGNLQIANALSVALDPTDPNRLYTSLGRSGWAVSSGSLAWSTMDLTPAAGYFTYFTNLVTPGAGYVRVGAADPSAPPGSPSHVYRTLGFNFKNVEQSTSGGEAGTFLPVTNGIRILGDPNALFPPLAINPNKIVENGLFQDELLYGTDKVYTTDTSGTFWDLISPTLAAGDVITALAIAPSGLHAFYAGTRGGQVFVDLSNGSNGFPNRSTGLPGTQINGITVDPNNANIAYVMVDGFGTGHVFRTTDAGVSWTDISANLPDVPAYAMAIDARTNLPGQPLGKLYLGNEVGVHVSTDLGRSWTPLGQGLPHVPVVDLQFSTQFEKLVAATLGRGVFQISTDQTGPRIVSVGPAVPASPGLSSVTVTFDEAVDPRTFTASTVRSLSGPLGPIQVLGVNDLDPTRHTSFQITFLPQLADGVYRLVLGPSIADLLGNRLDQNQNTITGEEPGDRFSANFAINSSDNGRFITGLFHDILNRAADTEGFLQNLDVIDAERSRGLLPIALGFVTSVENRSNLIAQYYASSDADVIGNFLGRPASQAEITFWVNALQQGTTPEQIITAFVTSPEFFQNGGSTDAGFVNALYLKLLNRFGDAAGTAFHLGTLAQAETLSRAQVLGLLTNSGEYRTNLVGSYYSRYLGRSLTPPELDTRLQQLQAGLPAEVIQADIIGSGEYSQQKGIDDAAWLNAAFNDLLGRPADASAQAVFLPALQAGATRVNVALQILLSDEYRGRLVSGYYTQLLGRTPGAEEVAVWVNALQQGATDEGVLGAIASSPEYYQNQQGTATTQSAQDGNWLSAVYVDVLGRTIDSSGQNVFAAKLAQDAASARTAVAQGFTQGDEFRNREIAVVYTNYLQRSPSLGEFSIWQPLLVQTSAGANTASPNELFQAQVLASGEYFPKFGNSNAAWVTSLYNNVLKRAPDTAGLDTALTTLLDSYQDERQTAALDITNSTEYQITLVRDYYASFLRRPATASEIQGWLSALASGTTDEQVITSILASDEYFLNPRLGAGNNSRWLNQVFNDLLNRNTDPASQAFVEALNTGRNARAEVVAIILSSPEYRTRLINGYCVDFLGRAPSDNELNNVWLPALASGQTSEQVLAALLSSAEYFLRPHPYP